MQIRYEVETSVLKKFGSKVRLLRVQRNITQGEIGKAYKTFD